MALTVGVLRERLASLGSELEVWVVDDASDTGFSAIRGAYLSTGAPADNETEMEFAALDSD